MVKMKRNIILTALIALIVASCDKVSPTGVLIAGSGVEDRVKMSHLYFKEHKNEYHDLSALALGEEYTFLIGADSHLTTDDGRIKEMLKIGLDSNDLLYAHLGDIADTKAEYYIKLEDALTKAKKDFAEKYYVKDTIIDEGTKYIYYTDTVMDNIYVNIEDIPLPFFPVVGNHDITHNGWALWSSIFHSSFYDLYVLADATKDDMTLDHFIFLDTANGTLGREQVELIEDGVLDDRTLEQNGVHVRHTFVFSHTNIFRPSALQFASTFSREETFFLLDQLKEWNATMVFCGHVHKWGEEEVGGVTYLTLDSMSESNSPAPGDYLVRVHVKKDGTLSWEKVHMDYTKKK